MESFILEKEGIREVNAFYSTAMPRIFGMSSAQAVGSNSVNMLVFTDSQKVKSRKVKDQLNYELAEEFPEARCTLSLIESGPPVGAPLAIRITGDSLDDLQALTDEIRQLLLSQSGVLSVNDDLGQPVPSLTFVPDRQGMYIHNVNHQQVSEVFRLHDEGIKIGQFDNGSKLLDMRMRYTGEVKGISQDFSGINLFNDIGQTVPLDAVGYPKVDLELQHIVHYNYQRSNNIRAYLQSDTPVDEVLACISPKIKETAGKYPGINLEFSGENAARTEVFIEIGKIFLAVIF